MDSPPEGAADKKFPLGRWRRTKIIAYETLVDIIKYLLLEVEGAFSQISDEGWTIPKSGSFVSILHKLMLYMNVIYHYDIA